MGTKKLLIIFILIILNISIIEAKKLDTKNRQNFKNYALSTCISNFLSKEKLSKEIKKDIGSTVNIFSLDSYVGDRSNLLKVHELLKKWYQKKYESKRGHSMNFKRCFDFFNSEDLENLYQEISICSIKHAEKIVNGYVEICMED